jgi:hypothetical protein
MSEEIQYTIRTKPNSGNAAIVYVGKAYPGSAEGDAAWQIQRITNAGTDDAKVEFADGNTNFDNNWTNREALTYS